MYILFFTETLFHLNSTQLVEITPYTLHANFKLCDALTNCYNIAETIHTSATSTQHYVR